MTHTVYKALTIAGSDSGGGAGIQADLKTFQELGVYGMSVLTGVTAQNTRGVQAVYPVPVPMVEAQLQSIGTDLPPDAVKTGMLVGAEVIRQVAAQIRQFRWLNVVVDPVMIAKGGASLLHDEAVETLKSYLLPLAKVVTPNFPETEALTGLTLSSREDAKEAARMLADLGTSYVIIKGGHSTEAERSVDLLFDGRDFTELDGPRIHTPHTHGTGCTFSAALAAGLATGRNVTEAAQTAKAFIQAAIEQGLGIGSGHGPTNHWAWNARRTGERASVWSRAIREERSDAKS
ncbi:bifunctional hydroxymethylpyrimidine kinase/phosphomethylpyrimidine kinase [Paenibacillus sp. NPDC055715]